MPRIIRTCFVVMLTIIGWLSAESPELLQAYKEHGDQNADDLYQKLGREAQVRAGIPPQECLAIKKLDPTSNEYKQSHACTCNGAIFVQQERLDQIKAPRGYVRVTLFHEVMHVLQFKQHGSFKVINAQYPSVEKEASLEGAKLANCEHCTKEYAAYAHNANDTSETAQQLQKAGYATKQELLEIAQRQEHNHALCTYHKQNQNT